MSELREVAIAEAHTAFVPEIRNNVKYEMINERTMLRDEGFTLDLNIFHIKAELHCNLTLNAHKMEPNQDVYIGFIFRHAEPMEFARQSTMQSDDEEFDDDESDLLLKPLNSTQPRMDEEKEKKIEKHKGFDGFRAKVAYKEDDLSKATFTATDLWLDQATIPDLWNNGVLSNHLTSDPLAHDWEIFKEDSYI